MIDARKPIARLCANGLEHWLDRAEAASFLRAHRRRIERAWRSRGAPFGMLRRTYALPGCAVIETRTYPRAWGRSAAAK